MSNDLIVFDVHSSNSGVGHVAIVIGVSGSGVTVAQQNVSSGFTQSFLFSKDSKEGHWEVKSSSAPVLGWLRK